MPDVAVPRRRRWPWIVAALLLLAFLLRGPLLAPLVKHVVADQLAQAIDGHAQVVGAGGGWFSDLYLTGISAEAPLGPLRRLDIATLRATYGLGIIQGEMSALRSLSVEGIAATIDLRTRGAKGDGVIPPLLDLLPSPLPRAHLAGEVVLLLPDREVRLSNIRLDLIADQVSLAVDVQVDDAEPLQVQASFRRPVGDTLRLERAVVLGDTTLAALELVLGRTRQQLSGELQLGGGRLLVQADPAKARVVAEGLDLSALPPSLSALLASGTSEVGALRGIVAGEIVALHAPQGWNVAGSLSLKDLVVAGTGPFTAAGQWHLGDGVVHLPRISVSGPADSDQLTSVSDPPASVSDPAPGVSTPGKGEVTVTNLVWSLAERRPSAGSIRATIPDLRRWLPVTLPLPPAVRHQVIALDADVSVEGETLAIRTARLAGGGVELTVLGSIAASPWRLEAADVGLRIDLAAIAEVLPGMANLAGIVRLRATGTIPFTSDPATLLAVPGEVQVRGDDLMVSAVAVDDLRVDVHTADGRVHWTQAQATVAGITIATTGDVAWQDASWRGALSSMALTFPEMVATAVEPCGFVVGPAGVSIGPLRLASPAGTFAIEASHRADGGLLVIDTPHLDLSRLGMAELGGSASLGLDLRGQWDAPTVQLRLISDDLRIGTRGAHVDLQLTQDQNGIIIRSGRIDAGADGTVQLSGTLPLNLGRSGVTWLPDDGLPAAIDALVPELDRWLPVSDGGSANLQLRLGEPQQPHLVTGRLTFAGVRPRPSLDAATGQRREPLAELDGAITLQGTAEGVEIAVGVRADAQPVFSGTVRSPGVWDARTLTGGWRQRVLTGQLQMDDLQLARVAAALPGVRYLTGSASGRLALTGTVMEPQWSGTVAVRDVAAKFANDVPALAGGSAEVELAGRTVHLRQGVFDLGGAPVTVAGELTLAETPRVALRLDGRNVLLVQRHDARLRADLALTLDGPVDQLLLAGRAVVTSAVFSPDLSLWQGGGGGGDGRLVPFEFLQPPLSTMRFDVVVSSAFTSKDDGVRLVTSLVRAECDLDLHLRGRGAAPELSGRVVVREGHVFLPFSTLRLSTGAILFPVGDPFHPRLNAVATAQVRRWRVTLQVEGPLADPQINASGDGLDERDALLLLSTGSTSAELSGEEGQRAALGRLGTWLGREAWDLLDGESDPDAAPGWVDRLTLEFGRQVSEGGKDTIEAQVELTEPDSVPGLLLYGERDRWDDYNAGVILRFRWGGEP